MLKKGKNMKSKGFTLIELLVVISIIALLLSIMMPALSKAKAAAQRVVCASSLKQWTTVAFSFANDHKGKMPKAHQLTNNAQMPIGLNDATSDKTNGLVDDYAEWEKRGTPYGILKNYGLSEAIMLCPSQRWLSTWRNSPAVPHNQIVFWPNGTFDANWRRIVFQSYMYVAGTRDEKTNPSTNSNHNYGRIAPYSPGPRDRSLSNQLIVADTVMFLPTGSPWATVRPVGYYINHAGAKNDTPGFQNLGMADGSVQGFASSYYSGGLGDGISKKQWSISHLGTGGPFFYWEGTDKQQPNR